MTIEYISKLTLHYRVAPYRDKFRIVFYSRQRKVWRPTDYSGINGLFDTEQLAIDTLKAYAERNGWKMEEGEDHADL
jgi:hypothetical protein